MRLRTGGPHDLAPADTGAGADQKTKAPDDGRFQSINRPRLHGTAINPDQLKQIRRAWQLGPLAAPVKPASAGFSAQLRGGTDITAGARVTRVLPPVVTRITGSPAAKVSLPLACTMARRSPLRS